MSGILKRRFEEVEASPSPRSSLRESDEEVSSESRDSSDSLNPSVSGPVIPDSILKREKRLRTRRVHFENVTVYYFGRRQGFTSVPSQGGSTLGMSSTHSWVRQYSLGEFALEQERLHRDMLRDHLKEERLNSIKLKLTKNGWVESEEANALTADDISDEDLDNTEVDDYFFLQPLTTKKRRALLRSSGVKKIEVEEKHELRAIRASREDCGCDCRVFCDPETCACSVAGIKCQVDRMAFPCGCTKEGCSNAAGRVEFNPIRVRTHFLHTIMKLELEKSREQQQQASPGNGYHGENNNGLGNGSALVQSQHGLEYGMSDALPQGTLMHLQTPRELDEQLDDEEEEDDEDEDEEEEDEEDEEDSSSVCSGNSDSSTQSLANSDSEEDEDKDDEDEENGVTFKSRATPHVSHCEMVPVTATLCFTENSVSQDSPMNGNSFLLNSSPVEFQLESSSSTKVTGSACQPTDPLEREQFTSQDTLGGDRQQAPFRGLAVERYMDEPQPTNQRYMANPHVTLTNTTVLLATGCASKPDNQIKTNGAFSDQPLAQDHNQLVFQNILNNNSGCSFGSNSSSSHCSVPEPAQEASSVNGHSEISLLADNTKNIPLADHCPEVTAI
ncbi:unnamed protein product [Lota lota]